MNYFSRKSQQMFRISFTITLSKIIYTSRQIEIKNIKKANFPNLVWRCSKQNAAWKILEIRGTTKCKLDYWSYVRIIETWKSPSRDIGRRYQKWIMQSCGIVLSFRVSSHNFWPRSTVSVDQRIIIFYIYISRLGKWKARRLTMQFKEETLSRARVFAKYKQFVKNVENKIHDRWPRISVIENNIGRVHQLLEGIWSHWDCE